MIQELVSSGRSQQQLDAAQKQAQQMQGMFEEYVECLGSNLLTL